MAREFKLETWSKVRPLKHLPKGTMQPDGTPTSADSYLTSSDVSEKGKVLAPICAHYDLDPTACAPFTRADLPTPALRSGSDGKAMLEEYAALPENLYSRPDGTKYADANAILVELLISSAGNDLYSAAMRQLRPKTDKQINKAHEVIAQQMGISVEALQEMLAARK